MRTAQVLAPLALAALLAACAHEVAVDVGHSHAASGAMSARGVPEFEYNVALAMRVREALKGEGFRVRMIGERGDYDELQARTRDARGADLFISLHHDSIREEHQSEWAFNGVRLRYNDVVSGFSLFVSSRNPMPDRSLACAAAIGERLRAAGFAPSRYHADPAFGSGRPFADEANGVHWFDDLAVARTATMPALLIEAGVIVNRDEELRLRKPEVKNAIARAISLGSAACLK